MPKENLLLYIMTAILIQTHNTQKIIIAASTLPPFMMIAEINLKHKT
jgi:hypothetical protein